MITIPRRTLVLIAAACFATAAGAADLKIGTVDSQKVVKQSPQYAAAQQELNSKFESRARDLKAKGDKIQAEQDDLSKNGAVMSQEQLQDKQNQLNDDQRDFSRMKSELDEDAAMEQNAQLSKLQAAVNKAVQEVAKAQKFNLVLAGEAVYYKDQTVDITDLVLEQMKKDFKSGSADPKGGN